MTFKWTTEAKAIVADRLRAGDTAAQIGARLDVSRSAITGLLNRDKDLAAIGFARAGTSFNGGKTPRLTLDEKRARKLQYSRACKQRNNVVQFPQAMVTQRIVSHNVPLLVEDWLKLNGGPRRFERGVTTDTWIVRQYLTDRGIAVAGTFGGKWKIVRGPGRPKTGTWADVMAVVDEIRLSEGLQPFACRNTG